MQQCDNDDKIQPPQGITPFEKLESSKETLSNVALFLGEVRDGLAMVCPTN